jgi:hypothetical protein
MMNILHPDLQNESGIKYRGKILVLLHTTVLNWSNQKRKPGYRWTGKQDRFVGGRKLFIEICRLLYNHTTNIHTGTAVRKWKCLTTCTSHCVSSCLQVCIFLYTKDTGLVFFSHLLNGFVWFRIEELHYKLYINFRLCSSTTIPTSRVIRITRDSKWITKQNTGNITH